MLPVERVFTCKSRRHHMRQICAMTAITIVNQSYLSLIKNLPPSRRIIRLGHRQDSGWKQWQPGPLDRGSSISAKGPVAPHHLRHFRFTLVKAVHVSATKMGNAARERKVSKDWASAPDGFRPSPAAVQRAEQLVIFEVRLCTE